MVRTRPSRATLPIVARIPIDARGGLAAGLVALNVEKRLLPNSSAIELPPERKRLEGSGVV